MRLSLNEDSPVPWTTSNFMISRRSFLTAAVIVPVAPAILTTAATAKPDLLSFCDRFWPVIHGKPFERNTTAKIICKMLERITNQDCLNRNLLIIAPPRCGKTTITTVMWPAWEWSRMQQRNQYIASTWTAPLAFRNARWFRRLIESNEYQSNYDVALHQQHPKPEFVINIQGGHYFPVGVGSSLIGVGADRVICDDPHIIRLKKDSPRYVAECDWWDSVMKTRLSRLGSQVMISSVFGPGTLPHHLSRSSNFDTAAISG